MTKFGSKIKMVAVKIKITDTGALESKDTGELILRHSSCLAIIHFKFGQLSLLIFTLFFSFYPCVTRNNILNPITKSKHGLAEKGSCGDLAPGYC